MREGIRNLIDGLAMAFGIVWILLATLLLGTLVLQSSAARNLSEAGASVGVLAGGVVWACGAVFVVTYALAIMRGRYLAALLAVATSLLGIWVASRGPFVAADHHGPVLALGLAVGLASALVLVAGGISWALHTGTRTHRRRRFTFDSHRIPPHPA